MAITRIPPTTGDGIIDKCPIMAHQQKVCLDIQLATTLTILGLNIKIVGRFVEYD